MSNFATLVDWAKSQTEDLLASVLQALGVTVNTSNHDTPGQYGDVALRALRPTRPETHYRFVTREIVDTIPEGPEKDFANHLIGAANAWYHYSGLKFAPCHDAQGHTIANLYACPDIPDPSDPTGRPGFQTVQSITDALNALPDPVTGNGAGYGPFN